MNCISVLQKIAERATTIDGERVAPVAWECNCLEEVCGNAQNCVKVCAKEIPLTTAIARAGRAATWHTLRKWFDR